MKVGVCMYFTKDIECYAKHTYELNLRYCKKHGYDLIHSNKPFYKDRSPHWERLPLLLKHLPNYDYLIWIDADAFFYEDAPSIIENVNFIFSKDKWLKTINTGIFVVKNTKFSIDFLKIWAFDEKLYQYSLSLPKWHDQNAIIYLYEHNVMNIKKKSKVYPYGVLQRFVPDKHVPVYHMAGTSKEDRIKILETILKKSTHSI